VEVDTAVELGTPVVLVALGGTVVLLGIPVVLVATTVLVRVTVGGTVVLVLVAVGGTVFVLVGTGTVLLAQGFAPVTMMVPVMVPG